MNGTMKFTPKARGPSSRASSTGSSAAGGSASAGYIACAPARATASGSRGPADTLPMGASWIGSSQPSSSHTRFGMLQSYAPWAR